MPHVRLRESGRWQMAYRQGGETKWRLLPEHIKTRPEAELYEKIFAGDLAARPHEEIATGVESLHEVLAEWLARKKERRADSTWRGYKHHADLVKADPILKANPRLRDLTPEALEGFLRRREAATSGAMALKILGTLRNFFTWAVKKKHVELSPMPAVDWEPSGDDEPPGEVEPCSRAVLAAHLRAVHADLFAEVRVNRGRRPYSRSRDVSEIHARRLYMAVLRCLWGFGVRAVEVCRWMPADVRIGEEWPIPAVWVKAPKNKGGRRWVEIPQQLVRLFTRWTEKAETIGPEAPVFHTGDGKNARNAIDKFRQGWMSIKDPEDPEPDPEKKRALWEAHRPATFHAFRHAMASRGEEAGVPARVLSRGLLGHDREETTERYTHRSLERQRAAREQIAEHERQKRRQKPKPGS